MIPSFRLFSPMKQIVDSIVEVVEVGVDGTFPSSEHTEREPLKYSKPDRKTGYIHTPIE